MAYRKEGDRTNHNPDRRPAPLIVLALAVLVAGTAALVFYALSI
jgi:hypothetical protein